MVHFDASNADCHVFTFKEGLLSAIAHDLQIRVARWSADVDEARGAVDARFDARSLHVEHAMRGGTPDRGALGDGDRRKIEQSIADEVLHASRFPEIRFVSTALVAELDGYRVDGQLTLHGVTKPLSIAARREGQRLVAEARIHQPDFGIRPFSAMLGTLKIKPDVTVRLTLPAA